MQLPKSNVARFRCFCWVAEAAELQAASWVSHWPTPPAREPELAALAQALCWIAQERFRAAPAFRKVAPLTEKGRSEVEEVTGGGGPPRAPVKVWTLLLVVDVVETVEAAASFEVDADPQLDAKADAAVLLEKGASSPVMLSETVLLLPVLVEAAAAVPLASGVEDSVEDWVPATAALISSAVTSSTNKFCVKIHPGSLSTVSQELPLAVGSFTSPGANVPDLSAS